MTLPQPRRCLIFISVSLLVPLCLYYGVEDLRRQVFSPKICQIPPLDVPILNIGDLQQDTRRTSYEEDYSCTISVNSLHDGICKTIQRNETSNAETRPRASFDSIRTSPSSPSSSSLPGCSACLWRGGCRRKRNRPIHSRGNPFRNNQGVDSHSICH